MANDQEIEQYYKDMYTKDDEFMEPIPEEET